MALYFLSGTPEDSEFEFLDGKKRRARRAAKGKTVPPRKAARIKKRAAKKAIRVQKRADKKARPRKHRVAKIAAAPARAAFLVIVRFNVGGMAKKLAAGYKKNPSKIKSFWAKFGGKWAALAKAISAGSKQSIGVAPAVAAAAAAPIVIALIPLLKEILKGSREGDLTDVQQLANEGIDDLATNPAIPKSNVTAAEDFESGVIKNGDDTQAGASGIVSLFLLDSLPVSVAIISLIVGAFYYAVTYSSRREQIKNYINRFTNKFLNFTL